MTPTPEPWSLAARWVLPVDGPPLPGGVVVIMGERVAAVEPAGGRTPDVDLGDAAVLPGLVNAHTHLDLSGLRDRCPPSPDFPGWLRRVIDHRARQAPTPARIDADIGAGLQESLRCGTTLLGDIAAGGRSWELLRDAPVRSVVFYELLGLPEERAVTAWQTGVAWLGRHTGSANCRPGLSPHAPYSVRNLLFERVGALSPDVPVAIHVAESAAELELLEGHTGPFVAFLKDLGVWDSPGLVPGVAGLLRLYAERKPLLIHGNHLRPGDPIPGEATVVYCPRTHAAFGHPPHPFRQLLAAGVRVALGTDSLASNPDLDVLAEARFVHRLHPDVPGEVVLRVATLAGAEALGFEGVAGSLTPGKSADLVVVPLDNADGPDPYRLVLAGTAPVARTLYRGAWRA